MRDSTPRYAQSPPSASVRVRLRSQRHSYAWSLKRDRGYGQLVIVTSSTAKTVKNASA